MRRVDRIEWEVLKLRTARHLSSAAWLNGTDRVTPQLVDGTPGAAEVWTPLLDGSPLHLMR